MAFKNKLRLIILALVAELLFFGPVSLESLRAADTRFERIIVLPTSLPEKDRLTLVSYFPMIVEAEIAVSLAVYDDTTTKRPADYLELYDNAGHLLAISWFDRFGIERIAFDRGLVEDEGELEGVFVLVLEGDSV
jgi:hypothetical protein